MSWVTNERDFTSVFHGLGEERADTPDRTPSSNREQIRAEQGNEEEASKQARFDPMRIDPEPRHGQDDKVP